MGFNMKSTEQNAQVPTEVAATPAKKARSSTAVAAKKVAVKKVVVKKTTVKKTAVIANKAKSASKPKATESVATTGKAKVKKDVLVRDSFTMPQSEYQVLSLVKKACLQNGVEIKKSELLRIAVVQLAGLSVTKIATLQKGLNKIQAGRPKK
jgi:NDP-sugar pyrophosphorylase family protein